MFEERFPQKRAFVTGAASGLGLEFCRHLARDHWRLMIADINGDRLAEAAEELKQLGADIIAERIDVADHRQVDTSAARLQEEWGGVDLVFNNAGIVGSGEFESLSLEQWRRMIDIDLWSVIYGCRALVPILKQQKNGYLINTASSAGTLAPPQMASYNVAKAGVVALSETLKVELAPFGIGVTVICPTVFKTNLGESMTGGTAFDRNLQRQLDDSRVTPADVVEATFRQMRKNRLYVKPQHDAKWSWRLKRLAPNGYSRLMTYLYQRRKWAFSHLE